MGWDERAKKKELFDPKLSRFVIARHQEEQGKDREADPQSSDADLIAGFSMFRFEYDQGERLLYWSVSREICQIGTLNAAAHSYEVQIAEAWQRFGIGRFFVDRLLDLGRKWKMEKVMLTVLNGACHLSCAQKKCLTLWTV